MIKQNPNNHSVYKTSVLGAHPHFRKKALALSVASCVLFSTAAMAQAQQQDAEIAEEEVLVMGLRAAQATSIAIKRESAVVMDSLSADNIGKLPDVTIADSLQRIPGVQIRRSAGEGTDVSLRGLPQVATKLNGEAYLGAGAITTVQPSFSDLPAQLFKGADVFKTTSANQSSAGITGTIDLKTWRPFNFDEGMQATANLEVQRGQETQETDPSASALFSWRNDKVGAMISGAFSNPNLSNSYNGINTTEPGDSGWVNGVNDWGATQPNHYIAPQGVVTWNQVTERERYGVNAAFQADLGEGFEFIAEAFYASEDEYNRKVGMSATNKWQGLDYFTPTQYRNTGIETRIEDKDNPRELKEWQTWQEIDIDARRVKSFSQNDSFKKSSTNLNFELLYDNGGPLTGSVRYVNGRADSKKRHGYNEGDITNGSATGINPFYPAEYCDGNTPVGDEGGCFVPPNPLGYEDAPVLTYNNSGDHPRWSGFDAPQTGGLAAGSTMRDYMANVDSYNIGAYSSENNGNSGADLDVFRVDGNYKFDDNFFTSVDLGFRMAQRAVQEEKYHLFSPFYEEGCLVQWKATDVVLGEDSCSAGEMVAGEFQGYTALPPIPLNANNNVKFYDDFSPVSGVPGVWAVDPKDYDDPEAFHNRVFGSTQKAVVPGETYDLDYNENTFYIQGNFEYGLMSGNIGLRSITSERIVKQNVAGVKLPYGNTNVDEGDVVTRVKEDDLLPALNLAFDVAEDVVIRAAYAQNITPLDLSNWGDGLTVQTSLNTELDMFVVNQAAQGGNPALDPWKSTNYDVSVEWYMGNASNMSAAAFLIDVDSFVKQGTVPMQFPDPDGVVRRTIFATTPVQGEGGQLHGLELAGRFAFSDFTSNFMQSFGVDTNYTWSPSEQDAKDIKGDKLAFPDNSEHQANMILWLEEGPWQARVAYNYRSERLAEEGRTSGNLNVYQDAVSYVDVSASYDINDNFSVYMNGSNVTGSYETYYMEWEDQEVYQNYYEPRYGLGFRYKM
ncbi:TonB-dependent receptor [Agaribacterium sp. ZY112]|uniref:TonB-dependent receptor n=1 Tax=Agaribacterium sp. ZY112 TaxID=3233574 RepID=UPI0035234E21